MDSKLIGMSIVMILMVVVPIAAIIMIQKRNDKKEKMLSK